MKTKMSLSSLTDWSTRAALTNWGYIILLSGVVPSMARAADPSGDAGKTHTLFMGADFEVQQHHHYWRINGVTGGSFIITENNEKTFVPMNRGAVSMKVFESLKLTTDSAFVAGFKAEPGYTDANDPRKKFMREDQGAAMMADDQLSERKFNAATTARAQGSVGPMGNVSGGVSSAQQAASAQTYSSSNQLTQGFDRSSGAGAGQMEEELAKEKFDAMEVEFTVSSPKPLANPYVVLVAQYREKGEKSGTGHSWIYAQELRPIDSHPRKERIAQGGLPEGFELQKCELHLYNQGGELATNISSKRVALSQEEAFEYLVIDYVSSHKGATLPAAPIMGEVPSDLYTKLSADQVRTTYFVKVDESGLPEDVYSDAACVHKVEDSYIQSTLKNLRYKPALEKGKAVRGVSEVKLNRLSVQA